MIASARSRRSPRPARRSATTCSCSATADRSPRPTMPSTCSSGSQGLDGFYGASSMERLPTELAITRQTRDFAGLRLNRSAPGKGRDHGAG